jgi:phosphoglycolate phosphatase
MTKLLLFDIDGTLLSTQGAGMRAMRRAGIMVFGESFTFEGIEPAGGLDPMLVVAAAERCGIELADHHHSAFRETYCRILPEELAASGPRIRVMPGVIPLLEQLRNDPRVTLGVLTGNYGATAELKLRAGGIDPEAFVVRAFGDDGRDRPALVSVAMHRYEQLRGHRVPHRNIIVIGDTPRDVHAAAANGCPCLAVATGPYTVEQLTQAGADAVAQDLADPRILFQMIEQDVAPSPC